MANVFLKNTATKWQSNLIDLPSAYTVLSSQTIDQVKNWLVFVDNGEEKWMNILECPLIVDLLKTGGQVRTQAIEIEVPVPQEFYDPQEHKEVPAEELSKSTTAPAEEQKYSERRMHPRFDIRLRVIIKSGKNTFLTYTNDVSLGGLSLITDVPEYIFSSEAEIYITAPDSKNNIKLICSPVPSKFGKSRLMFTQVEEEKQKVLASWLHHVVKPNATKVTQTS